MLVDPGYTFDNADWPRYGHRTSHHSTINLSGLDQSHSRTELRLSQAPGYDLIEGHYDGGYWPLESYHHGDGLYGEHARTLLWIRDRCVVVIDNVYTTSGAGKKPAVECVWQLSEGPAELTVDACRAVTRNADANILLLWPVTPAGAVATIHTGETEPRRGWLVSNWGRSCTPAPMLRLCAEAYDPWNADFAAVLIPFKGATAPSVTASGRAPDIGDPRSAGRLELRWDDGSVDTVVWTRRLAHAIDGQHGLETDGSLVHLRRAADGTVTAGLLVDGTHLEVDGRLADHVTALDRLREKGSD